MLRVWREESEGWRVSQNMSDRSDLAVRLTKLNYSGGEVPRPVEKLVMNGYYVTAVVNIVG